MTLGSSMKIKSLLTAIMIVIAGYSIAQDIKQEPQLSQNEINTLKAEIIEIKKDIALSKNSAEDKFKIIEMSSAGISNQISTASLVVGIFSVLFAIFGLLFGVFIARIQKKTEEAEEKAEKARNEAKAILIKVDAAKSNVDNTFKLIENNIAALYEKLKQEETNNIISRLKREPGDINNFFSALTTRELSADYYRDIKNCLLLLVGNVEELSKNKESCELFLLLLMQHFPGTALLDEQIYPEIKKEYDYIFSSMFNHEIEFSIENIFMLASENINKNSTNTLDFISELKRLRPEKIAIIERCIVSTISNSPLKTEWENLLSLATKNNPVVTNP